MTGNNGSGPAPTVALDFEEPELRFELVDNEEPELAGFALGYRTVGLAGKYTVSQAYPRLLNADLSSEERQAAALTIIGTVFSAWQGATPEVLHYIAPDHTSPEWVARKKAELAAVGLEQFPFSRELLRDVCLGARFDVVGQMVGCAVRVSIDREIDRILGKNVSASGGSTGTPEETTAARATSPDGAPTTA